MQDGDQDCSCELTDEQWSTAETAAWEKYAAENPEPDEYFEPEETDSVAEVTDCTALSAQ